MPKISCVLPVFNGLPYFESAVDSVLKQSFGDFELLLIDDGSTDGSGDVCRALARRDMRIRLMSKPNSGIVETLNLGIALAQAPYVARMDADDICHPDRFARQIEYLEEHPEVVVLGSRIDVIDAEGRFVHRPRAVVWMRDFGGFPSGGIALCHPTVMFRRDAFLKTRGYSELYHAAEDYALWLEMSAQGAVTQLADYLLRYRVHEGSVSRVKLDRQRFSCLKAELVYEARLRGRETSLIERFEQCDQLDELLALLTPGDSALPSKRAVMAYFSGQLTRRLANRGRPGEALAALRDTAGKVLVASPRLARRADRHAVLNATHNLARSCYAIARQLIDTRN